MKYSCLDNDSFPSDIGVCTLTMGRETKKEFVRENTTIGGLEYSLPNTLTTKK